MLICFRANRIQTPWIRCHRNRSSEITEKEEVGRTGGRKGDVREAYAEGWKQESLKENENNHTGIRREAGRSEKGEILRKVYRGWPTDRKASMDGKQFPVYKPRAVWIPSSTCLHVCVCAIVRTDFTSITPAGSRGSLNVVSGERKTTVLWNVLNMVNNGSQTETPTAVLHLLEKMKQNFDEYTTFHINTTIKYY